jgi:hypothetical protein
MEAKPSQVGWSFWLYWVLFSAAGIILGFLIGFALASIITGDNIEIGVLRGIFGYSMLGAGLGSMVGLMQRIVLRRYVSRSGWWVLASTAGFAVAFGGGYVVAVVALGYSDEGLGNLDMLLGYTVVVAIGGAVTGILQWWVLRGKVSRAGWWVVASTVGWGLSMVAAGIIEVVLAAGFFAPPAAGVLLGGITGGALVWLLRQPVTED